jgi:transcriptional regulator with XRE-family HTH domain
MDEDELPRVFGEVIRDLRQRQRISQETLAAAAGVDPAYVDIIERALHNVVSCLDPQLVQVVAFTTARRRHTSRISSDKWHLPWKTERVRLRGAKALFAHKQLPCLTASHHDRPPVTAA